jgi:bifunctional non-homologous end joining protein LigD
MQTEDHPLDYGEFEGVIPEGYGAGIVMLWDRGTWTPEVDDVDAALKKGDLKFTLNGYKLKGSWVLVRTAGRGAGPRGGRWGSSAAGPARSWLLIKHRDEWAGELDIAAFAPRSVKSDGEFEDILGGEAPAIWRSNRPAKSGDAGAMLARIIERAATLKSERAREGPSRPGTPRKPTPGAAGGPQAARATASPRASQPRPSARKARRAVKKKS